MKNKKYNIQTEMIHKGRDPTKHFGAVNTPPFRASTILFEDYKSFKESDFTEKKPWSDGGLTYGRRNTPITHDLSDAIKSIDGADHCYLTGSGVAALSTVMSGILSNGDHLLIMDGVYTPTKKWAEHYGKRMGISYDIIPHNASKEQLEGYFNKNTKLVMLEAPASLSFEIPDIPMITDIAHKKGAIVALDNTWSAGVFLNAFNLGCDISIQAGTKYYLGHSDGCFGSISCTKKVKNKIFETLHITGQSIDADTAFLALRGLRTLYIRLKKHEESALKVAEFLDNHNKIKQVLHPALKTHPDHKIFKRDFTGSTGLFSITLKDSSEKNIQNFVDNLSLFGIGFSWGGFESLIMPCLKDNLIRKFSGNLINDDVPIRLHIGLENTNDLIKDLEQSLKML